MGDAVQLIRAIAVMDTNGTIQNDYGKHMCMPMLQSNFSKQCLYAPTQASLLALLHSLPSAAAAPRVPYGRGGSPFSCLSPPLPFSLLHLRSRLLEYS